ncbi:tyrosine-type recombinase/integrase [Mycolicibacterium sphagni]|uniref:Transposase n=1 Tax=Mycolicibacterium sphagni TaxID=1786 RepID=A0ABX2K1V6_9MYCO|nr:tyrosine-type recombinase/integrase [Mycolicibacterium sphagni]NTY63966.1 transposase [Mycolicibacterium sphagni]
MIDEPRPRRLRGAEHVDPIWRLADGLPPQWRGPILGPGIENWASVTENDWPQLDLSGLPHPFAAELAWMAHWQACDGTRVSVLAMAQFANIIRRAVAEGRAFAPSIREMDYNAAAALQSWFYASRGKRLPSPRGRARVHGLFGFARHALIAACHDGPWWELDFWHPRCDPRIPLTDREPIANYGCPPGHIQLPWLRAAVKWHLGTALESGVLRWTTVSQERMRSFRRFDNWLITSFGDPTDILGDPATAVEQAAAFARWTAVAANRVTRESDTRHLGRPVPIRGINDDLRAVAGLLDFVAANPGEARTVLGATPWQRVTTAHAASWFGRVTRIPHQRGFNDANYIDDHALAQITAALPLIALPRTEQMTITRGDGTTITANGLDDPQAMRMILLQILTGRRASEIRTCDFDCLSATPRSAETGDDDDRTLTRFRYAQSKIDVAPDTILVDHEVTEVIAEQHRWLQTQHLDGNRRFLFARRLGNRRGDKPYPAGTYNWVLRTLSDLVEITDAKGRVIRLSHTHRFRHTRLTRLAELGLPVHVLQRYAGHATPTMTMHYIAARDEHAEQAFLATAKLRSDGTRIQLSSDDHDSLHLFRRADRFLPNGWCMLPPLQSCDKGNACLTCSVFVTDHTHRDVLQRQLRETADLINRATTEFEQRHGRAMPEDNVWLIRRRAEHHALNQLLAALDHAPISAAHGAPTECHQPSAGPVALTLDLTRHRRSIQ